MSVGNGRPRHKSLAGLFLFVVLLDNTKNTCGQLETKFNQTAKEGDTEVVISCDYSQFTSTTSAIQWDELNEDRVIINHGFVNDDKIENRRFKLTVTPGKADLVLSQPMRNDSGRTFQCEIQTTNGDTQRLNPSMLTIYYLDQPILDTSASTVYEGQSVTFTCSKPDGDPIPHITWYKDGQTANTNNPSRYEIANTSTESVLKIKSATEEDGGRYTCKAKSDQFKGDDAKTSVKVQLHTIEYYIVVTFTSKDGFATCTAEGHPTPSSVLILQDGEVVKEGENTATIEIDDEICPSSFTCFAENGNLNETTTMEKCNTDLKSFYIILIVVIIVGLFLFLWLLLVVCKYFDL
ncbi:junctional adhesion molecule B-like [Antedon mediterranea]|uniref:junctional adhesion molecule B-like n=1 Tax=Antedon mediterranea TaxID=105859 RepID=UPI003AF81910